MQKKAKRRRAGLLAAVAQALLILAVSVAASQLVVIPLFEDRVLSGPQQWEVGYLTGGTIDLLAERLETLQTADRQAYLDSVSHNFGFGVALRPIAEIGLEPQDLELLRCGEVVGDPSTYSAYRRLERSDDVLVFDRFHEPAEHLTTEAQRRHMGTLSILQDLVKGQSAEEAGETIRSVADRFEYPVRLLELGALDLSPGDMLGLREGRIVTVGSEESASADYPAEWVYQRFGEQSLVLGPFSPPTLKLFYPLVTGYYVVIGLIVLLPLVVWLLPTWRSAEQLSVAATAFGRGEFEARAREIKGSKTNNLIRVFNQMAEKIQGLIESNKALINSVSHELRTPISRIEFNIELARQSADLDERNRQLDGVEDSIDELKTLVDEMLRYARFERQRPGLDLRKVDVEEWLRSEAESWPRGSNVPRIHIDPPDATVSAQIDRYYMSRAVGNLVRNACRFARSQVRVTAGLVKGGAEIAVSDDGPGIDSQYHAKVFEPFARLDESRSRESGGAGLGLAIVHEIVSWHAGSVHVERSKLGGAVFIIRWPQTGTVQA